MGGAYRVMPLLPEPPGMCVMGDLPPFGSAVPVVVTAPSSGEQPRQLPTAGDWVKLKAVGPALHEVRAGLRQGARPLALRARRMVAGGQVSCPLPKTLSNRGPLLPACRDHAGPAVPRRGRVQPHHDNAQGHAH